MIWPAIYVSDTYWRFWFLIIATIVLELFVLKYFLKFSWIKSLGATIIGNLVSGFIGTFVMMWGMLVWHFGADQILNGTFNPVNWIATYIIMCMGSVVLELFTVKAIFKESSRKLFFPLLLGNAFSYAFIAIVMITDTGKDPDVARTAIVKYLPDQQDITLLDSTKIHLDTSVLELTYDENGSLLNSSYLIKIPFTAGHEDKFNFSLVVPGETSAEGSHANLKFVRFHSRKDTYDIILQQKNPTEGIGWKKPIVTDTLIFRKVE